MFVFKLVDVKFIKIEKLFPIYGHMCTITQTLCNQEIFTSSLVFLKNVLVGC